MEELREYELNVLLKAMPTDALKAQQAVSKCLRDMGIDCGTTMEAVAPKGECDEGCMHYRKGICVLDGKKHCTRRAKDYYEWK